MRPSLEGVVADCDHLSKLESRRRHRKRPDRFQSRRRLRLREADSVGARVGGGFDSGLIYHRVREADESVKPGA